jgi:hypothetical protein
MKTRAEVEILELFAVNFFAFVQCIPQSPMHDPTPHNDHTHSHSIHENDIREQANAIAHLTTIMQTQSGKRTRTTTITTFTFTHTDCSHTNASSAREKRAMSAEEEAERTDVK